MAVPARVRIPKRTIDILLVDDDPLVLRAFEATLRRRFRVHSVTSGSAALAFVESNPDLAVAVIDQRMPGMSGAELIRELSGPYPDLVRIIVTGYQDIASLKDAINNGGAYRYLEKPCSNEDLVGAVASAIELHDRIRSDRSAGDESAAQELREANRWLAIENAQLRIAADQRFALGHEIVGASPALQRVLADADRVAGTDTTVLIEGETGTGKDLLARYLHHRGTRRNGMFRAQNCGAVGEQLIEDLLFGHVPGAFTGARGLKKGLFEIASGGTLFLDEVGECSPSLQSRLLRVVEERLVHRLGDDERAVPVDVRLIAATNRDLRRDVDGGRFRSDLYYRLSVFRLVMPPLRERREDLPALAEHFLRCFNERARLLSGKQVSGFDAGALAALSRHEFPGNVRELANLLERAWLFADDGDVIATEHVLTALNQEVDRGRGDGNSDESARTLKQSVIAFKARHIAAALDRNAWNVSATARELGITRGRLYEEIRDSGLQRPDP